MITRYFLRRLAIARRDPRLSSPNARYKSALVEVILVVLGLPGIALLSFVAISTIRLWRPIVGTRLALHPFTWPALALWVSAIILGHRWFGRRFERYRDDSTSSLEFASEKDGRIAFWTKLGMIILCGVVIPWLGIALDQIVK
jgi:hypothetical protein